MTAGAPSGYKAVWLLAMFDLPVKTQEQRKLYQQFQKGLLQEGFLRLQYSVYVRYLPSEDAAKRLRRRIRDRLPPEGQVRLLAVTDAQFGKMEVFQGKKRVDPEDAPEQLLLF